MRRKTCRNYYGFCFLSSNYEIQTTEKYKIYCFKYIKFTHVNLSIDKTTICSKKKEKDKT